MDKVRQHFEQEARKFDRIIQKLTPDYEEMLQAMLSAIRFEKSGSSGFSGAMAYLCHRYGTKSVDPARFAPCRLRSVPLKSGEPEIRIYSRAGFGIGTDLPCLAV